MFRVCGRTGTRRGKKKKRDEGPKEKRERAEYEEGKGIDTRRCNGREGRDESGEARVAHHDDYNRSLVARFRS